MKFRFCGDLDCPDWVLSEIASFSSLDLATVKQLVQQIILKNLEGSYNFQQVVENIAKDYNASNLSNIKGAVAVIHFILTNAAKYDTDETSLVKEVQQLGLPQDSSALIGRSYREFKEKLQASLMQQSYRVSRLVGTEWRIDQPLSTSTTTTDTATTTTLSTPSIHLKLSIDNSTTGSSENVKELALEISAEKLELLIHELSAAQASIQQLSN